MIGQNIKRGQKTTKKINNGYETTDMSGVTIL